MSAEMVDTEAMVRLWRPEIDGLVSECAVCGKEPVPFDYHVDFDFWRENAPKPQGYGVICLPCMARITNGAVHDHVQMIYFSGGGKTSPYVPLAALEQERAEAAALRKQRDEAEEGIAGLIDEANEFRERIRLLEEDRDMLMEELSDSMAVRLRVAAKLKVSPSDSGAETVIYATTMSDEDGISLADEGDPGAETRTDGPHSVGYP